MLLKDTVEQMINGDYIERFKAEYNQLEIRLKALNVMLTKWDLGVLDFTPNCDKDILVEQRYIMSQYLDILAKRAKIEGIEL